MDCGATCLRMIARHYGRFYSLDFLRERSFVDREGVSLSGIADAAESIGFHTLAGQLDYDTLVEEVPLPAIAHWDQQHFVVVYKAKKNKVWVADPAIGKVTYTKKEFMRYWASTEEDGVPNGILLMLETTPEFFQREGEEIDKKGFGYLFSYVFKYKKLLLQLFLGLIVGSIIQLIFPFLTQSIVDYGIDYRDIDFIYIILAAQLMLFFSSTAVEFIRSWILLHIGMRVNISLISDFLMKLMKLPLKFFDIKMTGDILQRIQDHKRIEIFLTSTTLSTAFALLNFAIFGVVLAFYNLTIFYIFIGATVLYVLWILIFLRKRAELDARRFEKQAKNHNTLIELITGMQEIKLHNAERQKRWKWEGIQASLFHIGKKSLALGQYQSAGAVFVNELKNIFISFIAAKSVIDGEMTLGMMLAVQYIIGQLNGPIHDMMNFIQLGQDAKISLERLGEIHERDDEEEADEKINILPDAGDLKLRNVSFRYSGPESPLVLNDINLVIPERKTTAIVGTSGSGKTTLLKILLNFYQATEGEVRLGDLNLTNIRNRLWRERCGVVMQDGYIFSDSIARNISLGDEIVDKRQLMQSVKAANIQEFIEGLPLGYNTKIGNEGIGLSQGQKQRLLIARAVYKDPDYLFFDEATNALDAHNEKIIMENLNEFFWGRTVVVVAHRLSTVKNADNIVVLDKGQIVEQGTHEELTALRGAYFHLVKNQLELGN